MRTDYVHLPLSYAKCVPLVNSCPQCGLCARAIVRPDKGRPLNDFSNSYIWTRGNCHNFLPASKFREAPKDEKVAHEAVKGLA